MAKKKIIFLVILLLLTGTFAMFHGFFYVKRLPYPLINYYWWLAAIYIIFIQSSFQLSPRFLYLISVVVFGLGSVLGSEILVNTAFLNILITIIRSWLKQSWS